MDKLPLTKCFRCRGALAYQKFYGIDDQFWGWKCLICGEIIDPVILENRQLMKADERIRAQRLRRE